MTSVVVGELAHVWEAVHTKRRVNRNQIVYVGLDHSRDWRLGLSAIIIAVPLAREYLSSPCFDPCCWRNLFLFTLTTGILVTELSRTNRTRLIETGAIIFWAAGAENTQIHRMTTGVKRKERGKM